MTSRQDHIIKFVMIISFIAKKHKMGESKNYPKLRDVIYGRPIYVSNAKFF